jgi:protein O-mannosyl-transferase
LILRAGTLRQSVCTCWLTYLFYLLVKKLSGGSQILPLVAALLFGLHPAHVESVAWISGVTDPLLSVFLLGSVLCFIKSSESHTSREGWKWQAAAWACCGLASLSKEPAVILPGFILVYDLFYERQESSWLSRLRVSIGRSLPFVSIIAVGLILRTFALRTLTAPPSGVPPKAVVLSWPNILVFYARHLLFPGRMSAFYDPPWASSP